ncbi:hypothetical protein ACH4S8_38000 [Streptomyces sp. NPDC021080]|uniref:hypothetical protein n=1 Tax=Streptomyces sp. NPDC021080 TaxID=3365110 RepID=UPI0037B3AD65
MGNGYWTSTGYGSWCNHGDSHNVSVGATVADAVTNADSDWIERMTATGGFARIEDDYRAAINEKLPDRVSLAGNDFYGPAYEDDYTWAPGTLNMREIIQGIDLGKIIERHDVDLVVTS